MKKIKIITPNCTRQLARLIKWGTAMPLLCYKVNNIFQLSRQSVNFFQKLYNVYDWLKVEYVELKNDVLKVYAAPNTTGKDQTPYIEAYSGPEYDVITANQEK